MYNPWVPTSRNKLRPSLTKSDFRKKSDFSFELKVIGLSYEDEWKINGLDLDFCVRLYQSFIIIVEWEIMLPKNKPMKFQNLTKKWRTIANVQFWNSIIKYTDFSDSDPHSIIHFWGFWTIITKLVWKGHLICHTSPFFPQTKPETMIFQSF